MIKLDMGLLNRLRLGSTNPKELGQGPAEKADVQKPTGAYSLNIGHSEVKSFSLFHKTLKRNISDAMPQDSKTKTPELSEAKLAAREERANLAAGNILSFIELRLRADVADGASEQELSSRIDAALEGFHKGYDEANQILEDLNLMSPELEQDIGLTKEKVLAGIDEFKQTYLSETDTAPAQASQEPKSESITPASNARYTSMEAGEARDFSFSLTTRDGDEVTINASSIYAMQARSFDGDFDTEAGQYYQQYQSISGYQESKFGFTVEGELDEGELKAINNLLNNVNDLAEDFYSGDMNAAFEKALSLEYNSSEISGFALSLTQVQNVKVMQAYQPEQEILKPAVLSELRPIGKFATELSRSLTMAKDMFSHPRELLSELTKQFNELNKPLEYNSDKPDFFQFAQDLLDTFEK